MTVDGDLTVFSLGGGTNFTLNSSTPTAGSLTLVGAVFSLNSGATLSITGNATDGSGNHASTSVFSVNDSTFTVGGTFTSSMGDQISVSDGGHVQLAALATGTGMNLAVGDSTSSLEIGTAPRPAGSRRAV